MSTAWAELTDPFEDSHELQIALLLAAQKPCGYWSPIQYTESPEYFDSIIFGY